MVDPPVVSRLEVVTANCKVALYRGLCHKVNALIKSRDHKGWHPGLEVCPAEGWAGSEEPRLYCVVSLVFLAFSLSNTASYPCRWALFTGRTTGTFDSQWFPGTENWGRGGQ